MIEVENKTLFTEQVLASASCFCMLKSFDERVVYVFGEKGVPGVSHFLFSISCNLFLELQSWIFL